MEYKIKSEIDYSGMDTIVYFLYNSKKYKYKTFVDKNTINIEIENIENVVNILIDDRIVLYENDFLEV